LEPNLSATDFTRQYARTFFGAEHEEAATTGLLGLVSFFFFLIDTLRHRACPPVARTASRVAWAHLPFAVHVAPRATLLKELNWMGNAATNAQVPTTLSAWMQLDAASGNAANRDTKDAREHSPPVGAASEESAVQRKGRTPHIFPSAASRAVLQSPQTRSWRQDMHTLRATVDAYVQARQAYVLM
jgi:hypothetical protein